MIRRRRKGNIMLSVVILIVLLITFVSLLSLNVAQKNNARNKAATAGDINSYISMANACAWAFKDDLESQSMKIVIADVSNPQGTNIGIEIFDKVAAAFQMKLQKDETEQPARPWIHKLSNPYDAIDFAGINDSKATQHMQRILENASVTVTVNSILTAIRGPDDDVVAVEDGGSVTFADIYFDVVLTKGTWRVSQSYKLSGEKVVLRLDDAYAVFKVNRSEAKCTLITQTVSRTLKNT